MEGSLFSLWCPAAACLSAGRLLWYSLFIAVVVAAYLLASILLLTAYAVDGGIDFVVLCFRESALSRFVNARRRRQPACNSTGRPAGAYVPPGPLCVCGAIVCTTSATSVRLLKYRRVGLGPAHFPCGRAPRTATRGLDLGTHFVPFSSVAIRSHLAKGVECA